MLLLRCNEHGLTEVGFAPDGTEPRRPTDPLLLEAMLRLEAYFAGATADFSDLPLAPAGTPFQSRVWSVLRAILPGTTRRYGDIAADIGTAARAVGVPAAAIPCCWWCPATGSSPAPATAASWAPPAPWPQRKQQLLNHERRFFAA